MIKTTLLMCASRVIRDAVDNRMSAIDILDDFVCPTFPIVFPRTSVLWMLERDADDPAQSNGTLTILLNDAQLQQFQVDINFADQTRTRAVTLIGGMVISGPGLVKFCVRRAGADQDDAVFWFRAIAGPPQEAQGALPGIIV